MQVKFLIKKLAIATLLENQKTAETKTQPIISNFDGLMARVNALNKLPWLPSFFIFLLFLAIETAPIFAKLVSGKGEYDFKLEDEETAIKTWVKQQSTSEMLQAILISKKVLLISKPKQIY